VLRITALVKYVPELTDRRFAADFTLDRDAAPGRLSELDAPIFELADFGVIGDLFRVIPQLAEEIDQRR